MLVVTGRDGEMHDNMIPHADEDCSMRNAIRHAKRTSIYIEFHFTLLFSVTCVSEFEKPTSQYETRSMMSPSAVKRGRYERQRAT